MDYTALAPIVHTSPTTRNTSLLVNKALTIALELSSITFSTLILPLNADDSIFVPKTKAVHSIFPLIDADGHPFPLINADDHTFHNKFR